MSLMGQSVLRRVFCCKCNFRSTSIKSLRFRLYIKNFKQSDSYETQSFLHDLSAELRRRGPYPEALGAAGFRPGWHVILGGDGPRV